MTRPKTKSSTPQQHILPEKALQGASRACAVSNSSRPSPQGGDWTYHVTEEPPGQGERKAQQAAGVREKGESPVGICEHHETKDDSKPSSKLAPSQRDSARVYVPDWGSSLPKQNPVPIGHPKIYKNNEDDRAFWQSIALTPFARSQTQPESHVWTHSHNGVLHGYNDICVGVDVQEWAPFGKALGEDNSLGVHRTRVTEKTRESNPCEIPFLKSSTHGAQWRYRAAEANHESKQSERRFAHAANSDPRRKTKPEGGKYRCQECRRSYVYQSSLLRHMEIHTGEKPYKCQTCGKAFKYSLHLNKHLQKHIIKKPYKCGRCGETFNEFSKLTEHRKVHVVQKPYNCEECGKAFITSHRFKTHLKTHS